MAKKKKNMFFLSFPKASWLSGLVIGAALGIASQRIPEIRAYTNEVIQPLEQHFPYLQQYTQESPAGQPVSFFLINRSGYALAYDARNKNPAWVYECLTAESCQGNADRSHFDFREDENIPSHLRATLADYKRSGFDRGHMAPAADHRSSAEEMKDTFYLSNMCPQCAEFNRGYWAKLEKQVRDLTKAYQKVHVITGPLYLPYQESNGKRFIKYPVIGPNDVGVPTHFFKVITLEDHQGRTETMAYILPNQEIASNTPLDNFRTTVQKIEKLAGIVFAN